MRRRTWGGIAMGIGGAVIAVASGFQLARAYFEEPSYEVVSQHGAVEVRRYAPRIVAETHVAGTDRQRAMNEGFRRLADYIFGGNQRIDMTVPVEVAPSAGERIAMTTPVEAEPADEGWRVAFTMPSEHALEDLPTPRDARVQLRRIEPRTVAVLRFSGRVSDRTRAQREAELLRGVRAAGLEARSDVSFAFYDPPHWVVPVFRRNEAMVEVHRPQRRAGL